MTKDKTVSEMYNESHPIDNDNEDLEIFLKNEPHWEIRPISDLEAEIEKLKTSMSDDVKRNSFIRAEIDRFLGLIFVMKSERGKQQLYKNLENTIKYICLIEGNVFNIENTEGVSILENVHFVIACGIYVILPTFRRLKWMIVDNDFWFVEKQAQFGFGGQCFGYECIVLKRADPSVFYYDGK